MQWLALSKNNLFFVFLVFGYIFGVMLYDFIGFNYTDEMMAAFLALFVVIICIERKSIKDLLPLIFVSSIFAFYIIYSFLIHSNTPIAIIQDAIIQYKPYLAFFSVLLLRPQLTKQQKLFLTMLCIAGTVCLIIIAGMEWYQEFFGHPSRFATASVVTAFVYLYCCSFSWKDIFFFLFILAIGLFSTRSKSYGFVFLATTYICLVKAGYKFRFSLPTLILSVLIISGILYVAWDKTSYYFIQGTTEGREMFARPALYYVSGLILIDYFPFGSGLGTFATFTSAVHYSPTYKEYGIDHFFGLSKDDGGFISDTFYPSLAEFGIVGIILFIYFWIWVIRLSMAQKGQSKYRKFHMYTILIICFFLIESIADTTFTHNRGMFMLILMAMGLQKQSK